MNVTLHSRLYEDVTPAREREWRSTLMDLNLDLGRTNGTDVKQLTLDRRPCGGVEILVERSGGGDVTVPLTFASLRRHFREYRGVIEQLAKASAGGSYGARDLETLDYAKKLVHDEAAEHLQDQLEGIVDLEHKIARRLFTLIFLVSTALPEALVTRHRHG